MLLAAQIGIWGWIPCLFAFPVAAEGDWALIPSIPVLQAFDIFLSPCVLLHFIFVYSSLSRERSTDAILLFDAMKCSFMILLLDQ